MLTLGIVVLVVWHVRKINSIDETLREILEKLKNFKIILYGNRWFFRICFHSFVAIVRYVLKSHSPFNVILKGTLLMNIPNVFFCFAFVRFNTGAPITISLVAVVFEIYKARTVKRTMNSET